jgi:hypothetical protein
MLQNEVQVDIQVYTLRGKEAIRFLRKEMVLNRRKRLLMKLIKERRALRNKK